MHVRQQPRFAHSNGHTNVCFSEDGRYVITCGNEGDVRIWKGLDDDDPTEKCVGEKAMAVVQKGSKLYVASDHNVVVLSFPDGEIETILTRFTALVTCIDVSDNCNSVLAGASDMEIHLVDVASSKVKYFTGHKAPILCVSFDPRMEYIVSSSCDGSVRVWLISDQTVVKEWLNVTDVSNSFENRKSLCSLPWQPNNGRLLAVPYNSEIKMYQRSTWNEISSMKSETSAVKKYSITCWSKCGRYLAASSSIGEITVWNTVINKIIFISKSKDPVPLEICSLAWNPDIDKSQIAYCDVDGQLSLINNCYTLPKPEISIANQNDDIIMEIEEGVLGQHYSDNDEDDPDAISLEKIKTDCGFNIDGQSDNDDDNADRRSSAASAISVGNKMPVLNLQPPFQSYSMPVHLQRRFMVFNDVGYVKQTNTEDENMLDVDFHDASIHHSFRINNLLSHHLGALNSKALILACEKDEQTPSKIVCTRFSTLDSNKEWSIELPDDENVQLVTVGNNFIAVATDFRFLRFFTLGGNQREIISLLGPIVTMNANNNFLVVVYHSSAGLHDDQNLSFVVYKIETKLSLVIGPETLPISPKSILKWAGFSDFNNLCIFDSNDILQIYNGGLWQPIYYNTVTEGRNNHLFVTGINEENRNIRCVFCKGTYYPLLIPHPFITEVQWKVPVCEPQFEKGELEETYLQSRIALNCIPAEEKSKYESVNPSSLKLFALACRNGLNTRALEFIEYVSNLKLSEIAHKYCTRSGNVLLADKISEYISKKKIESNRRSLPSMRIEYERRDEEDANRNYTQNKYYSEQYAAAQVRIPKETHNPIPEEILNSENECSESSSYVSSIASFELNKKKLSERLGKKKFNPFKISQNTTRSNNSADKIVQPSNAADTSSTHQNSEDNSSSPKITFVKWFRAQKQDLIAEFPNLAPSELTNVAAKRFALIMKEDDSPKPNMNTNTDRQTLEEESKKENLKRKSNENKDKDEPTEKKKLQSKLKMFAFQK